MKSTRFTQVLLTVIALNLTYLSLRDMGIFPKAYADDTRTGNYALVPINEDGSINVNLNREELDVNITSIDTYDDLDVNIKGIDTFDELEVEVVEFSAREELNVNLRKISGGWLNTGGPVPVEIVEE